MIIKSIPERGAPNPDPEVPANLRSGGELPTRRGLRAPLQAVNGATQNILDACTGLGVDPTDLTNTTNTLLLVVDPLGPTVASQAADQFGTIPAPIVQRTKLTQEKLTGSRSKFQPMVALFGLLTRAEDDFGSSRQVTSTLMYQELQLMKDKFTAALPPGVPLTDQQKQLQRMWQPIADLLQKQTQTAADKVDAGKKNAERRAGELAQAGRHADMLQTMVDLRTGQPVDDARAAQAVATFQQEQAAAQQTDLSPLMPADAKARRARR